jgi:hypothetical protein
MALFINKNQVVNSIHLLFATTCHNIKQEKWKLVSLSYIILSTIVLLRKLCPIKTKIQYSNEKPELVYVWFE